MSWTKWTVFGFRLSRHVSRLHFLPPTIISEISNIIVGAFAFATGRLNERMYGELTGLSKKMVKQRHGEAQFKAWRRGYDVR